MDPDQCLYSGNAHYPVHNVLKTAFRDGRDRSGYDGMYPFVYVTADKTAPKLSQQPT